MAKQAKGNSKQSAKTSKAKTKGTGKGVGDKSLKSVRGGLIIIGGSPALRAR